MASFPLPAWEVHLMEEEEVGLAWGPLPASQLSSHPLDNCSLDSDLEEGESQGLPVWSNHVGDPILKSNMTRRVDFALFMVEAIGNRALIHKAPAIVGSQTPSALEHNRTTKA